MFTARLPGPAGDFGGIGTCDQATAQNTRTASGARKTLCLTVDFKLINHVQVLGPIGEIAS